MRYIPIVCLVIAILSGGFALKGKGSLFELQSNGKFYISDNTKKYSTVLTGIDEKLLSMEKQQALNWGGYPLSQTKLAIAFPRHQQNEVITQISEIRTKIEELRNYLNMEIENRRFLQEQLVKMSKKNSEVSLSTIIAFSSLFVSIIAMLPSWIQLIRNENNTRTDD